MGTLGLLADYTKSVTHLMIVILGLLPTTAKHMPSKGLRSSTATTVRTADCAKWTRNVEVRVSEDLPTSVSHKFSGGSLLGTFDGPGTTGQKIIITGAELWILEH